MSEVSASDADAVLCPDCDYDARGQSPSSSGHVRCPECGLKFWPRPYLSRRARRARRWLLIVAIFTPILSFLLSVLLIALARDWPHAAHLAWLVPIASYATSLLWVYHDRANHLDRPRWGVAALLALPVAAATIFVTMLVFIAIAALVFAVVG